MKCLPFKYNVIVFSSNLNQNKIKLYNIKLSNLNKKVMISTTSSSVNNVITKQTAKAIWKAISGEVTTKNPNQLNAQCVTTKITLYQH